MTKVKLLKTPQLMAQLQKDGFVQNEDFWLDSDGWYVTVSFDDMQSLFEMAYGMGVDAERSKWDKPEEFNVSHKLADAIDKAIEEYPKTGRVIDSIRTETINDHICKVVVDPSNAVDIFNIGMYSQKHLLSQGVDA